MDYATANQVARVYVNNVLAGSWYNAGSNTWHRFRDSEFLIPPRAHQQQSDGRRAYRERLCRLGVDQFGYWAYSLYPPDPPLARADFDGDGDVDQADFGHFQICLTGSGGECPPAAGCWDTLLDADTDVDDSDLAIFRSCFNSARTPCPRPAAYLKAPAGKRLRLML